MTTLSPRRQLVALTFLISFGSCLLSAANLAPSGATPAATPCPSPTPYPSPAPLFLGFDAYEENDSLVVGDERYTQGLKVSMSLNTARARWVEPLVIAVGSVLWPSDEEPFEPGFAFTLGQNMYTPTIITSKVLDPNDRAFSGFAYVGGQLSATDRSQTTRHILELDLGFLGRKSFSKHTQTGLHVLKTSRIPKGWEDAKPNGPGFNFYYRGEHRSGRIGHDQNLRWDLTAGPSAELGNVRTSFGAHAAFRIGYRLTGFPATVITQGVRRSSTAAQRLPSEFGVIAGVEGRQVVHTNLVKRTGGSGEFDANLPVLDKRLGLFFRIGSFRLTGQKVWRSPEFSIAGVERRDQDFVTIAASFEPTFGRQCPSCLANSLARVFRYTEIELGMGKAISDPTLAPEKPAGISGHIGLRIKGYKNFNVGVELGGIGVASDAVKPGPDPYADLFLRQSALSLGYRPFGPKSQLALRAGSSFLGQRIRIQQVRHPMIAGTRTEDSEGFKDYKVKRGGWLVGAQFFQPIESHLALGFDFTLRRMRAGETVPGLLKPRFAHFVFAIQIRP